MCFFKKKKSVANSEDRELIESNSKSVDALIVLAGDNSEYIKDLQELKEKLKYLMPSPDSKILDYDKKIKNNLDDMRIALTKADGEESKKVDRYFTDIKLLIADRNARI